MERDPISVVVLNERIVATVCLAWLGTSIGLVDEIKPAEQVIRELEAGAIERVIKLEGLLQQE